MKVTGTKGYVQVEDDNGNIARFDGEVCLGAFMHTPILSGGSDMRERQRIRTGLI